MSSGVSFAVVVPMYNEEQGAAQCVCAVCTALSQFPNSTALVVVNDGSHDRTGEILAEAAPAYERLVTVTHVKNGGYGVALKTGARRAADMGFDYVLFMDSDLTNDPQYLPLFIEKMEHGYDIIKASRYIKGGGFSGVPAWRVSISRLGNLVARVLYGLSIHDCTNGFRAIRTVVFNRMPLLESRFPIIMEELYYAKIFGCSVTEVPNILTNRSTEQRATAFSYRPVTFWHYLKYALRAWLRIKPRDLSQNKGGY